MQACFFFWEKWFIKSYYILSHSSKSPPASHFCSKSRTASVSQSSLTDQMLLQPFLRLLSARGTADEKGHGTAVADVDRQVNLEGCLYFLSECFHEVQHLHWTCCINAWIIKFYCPQFIFMQSHFLWVPMHSSLSLALSLSRYLSFNHFARPILLTFFRESAPVLQIHLCMNCNDLSAMNGLAVWVTCRT